MNNFVQERPDLRAAFLSDAGWSDAASVALTGDASTRSYERLSHHGKNALLMNAPPGAEEADCPPDASDEERRHLGYNAMARLAGPNLNAFIAIGETLRAAGVSAPTIYHADPVNGFALIEDFGDDLYTHAISRGLSEEDLYKNAIDALLTLRRASPAQPRSDAYVMLPYDHVAMRAEVGLLVDWYWEHKTGSAPSTDLQLEYLTLWDDMLGLLSDPHLIILRDYHAENLLWLPDRDGAARTGVIDFQDGLFGHAAYDLVSMLEDARRDVPFDLAKAMIDYYCRQAAGLSDFNEERLRSDYALLGAQRNAKILGIFARLIHRDGKQRYAAFIPRVEAHFRHDLTHPALAPLQNFLKRNLPELGL